jgi:hypothetical protein
MVPASPLSIVVTCNVSSKAFGGSDGNGPGDDWATSADVGHDPPGSMLVRDTKVTATRESASG